MNWWGESGVSAFLVIHFPTLGPHQLLVVLGFGRIDHISSWGGQFNLHCFYVILMCKYIIEKAGLIFSPFSFSVFQ